MALQVLRELCRSRLVNQNAVCGLRAARFSGNPLYTGTPSDDAVREAEAEIQDFFGSGNEVADAGVLDLQQQLDLGPALRGEADLQTSASAAGSQADVGSQARLTHVDEAGVASMVDVGQKLPTQRTAEASGRVLLGPEAFQLVKANQVAKGDVLKVAQLAGIMATKATSSLIPLCHNIPISSADVELELEDASHAVVVRSVVRTVGVTGVEMEAMTAVSVAALTVYDMCKSVSKGIVISDVRLESKTGGKSGVYARQ